MKRLVVAAAFGALFLVQAAPAMKIAIDHTDALASGRSVLLAVETRDPRDLFRGEYSILAYEIGRPRQIQSSTSGLGASCDLKRRSQCYVPADKDVFMRLEPDEAGVFRAAEALFERPPSDEIYIAGKVRSGTLNAAGPVKGSPDCQHEACFSGDITYGIENWYGPQGVPAKVDRIDRKDILVRAKLNKVGRAVLDALVVKGEDFARTSRLW